MTNLKIGNYGEDLACKYLEEQGYELLERNFRIRGGEIDIIARDEEFLVFVEVKTRYSHDYGHPAEALTYYKIKALLKTSQFYLQKIGWGNKQYRLDAVLVDFANSKKDPQIELIKNITF